LQQQEAGRLQMQQQLQQQWQQQEAERLQMQQRLQQQEAENANRQAYDILRAGQEAEEEQHRQEQRDREQQERLEEALREYDNPASQQQHEDDEERRRTQEQERRRQCDAEDDENINQAPVRNIPIPDGAQPYTEPIDRHTLGPLNVECPNCHAMHFACERLTKSSARNPRFGTCCLEGKVDLPPFPAWPLELQQAYGNRAFVSKIRQYNSALAFTSVGVTIEDRALQGSGPNAFHIHGSLHHLMGSLIAPEGIRPSYAQIYIYDPEHATDIRANRPGNENLDRRILRELHDMLYRSHPYVALYKQAYQVMMEKPPEQHTEVRARIHFQQGTDGRRYNLPTADEIAVIIPGDGSEEVTDKRDIVLRLQGGQLQRISQLSHAYSTLHYVLLFPSGEEGWHLGIPLNIPQGRRTRSKEVTQLLYYAFRLHP
ncbi:hypothetical protein EV424DRAFT_1301507, partial [Suillus variegatus]